MIGEKHTITIVVVFLVGLVILQTYNLNTWKEQSKAQDNAINKVIKNNNICNAVLAEHGITQVY